MQRLRYSPNFIATQAAQIMLISGDSNYTQIHFQDGRVVLMGFTLRLYAEQLPGFLRIHKRHLINPKFVAAITGKRGTSEICLLSGQVLPIARRRHAEVLNQLNE